MTFEHLVWHGLSQSKLRLLASVVAVACICAASVLLMSGASASAGSRYVVLFVAPVVFVSSSMAANRRKTRDRILFRFGFSQEQLATLLGLEGVVIGGLGAALGLFVSVAAWLLLPSSGYGEALMPSLELAPADLSFTFCAALVGSALAVLGPAYGLARSNLEDDDAH